MACLAEPVAVLAMWIPSYPEVTTGAFPALQRTLRLDHHVPLMTLSCGGPKASTQAAPLAWNPQFTPINPLCSPEALTLGRVKIHLSVLFAAPSTHGLS